MTKSNQLFSLAACVGTVFSVTNVAHAQVGGVVSVSESGYTLFFLGFALLGLALFNLRRRS